MGFESHGGSALHTHPVSVITAAGAKIDVLGRGPPKVTKWDFTCPAEVYVQKEARHCNPSPTQIQQGGLGLSLLVTSYLVLDCVCLGQNASCRTWFALYTMWTGGIKLSLSGLAPSAFTRWDILPDLLLMMMQVHGICVCMYVACTCMFMCVRICGWGQWH